jgi:hypothetical protein
MTPAGESVATILACHTPQSKHKQQPASQQNIKKLPVSKFFSIIAGVKF